MQCLYCKTAIPVKRKYCSRSCARSHQNQLAPPTKGKRWRKVPPRFCLNCGVEIHGKKYCSVACSNRRQPRRVATWNPCLNCDKKTLNQKYCSNICTQVHRKRKLIEPWLSGEVQYAKLCRWMRAYVIQEANTSCEKCGWNEIHLSLGYPPLHVDHIDGDDTNNQRENLRVYCPNHHTLTETWGFIGARRKPTNIGV